MEFNEPTGTDINVSNTPTSSLNEPVGEEITISEGSTGAKTAGGISLDVVPDSNFFDLLGAIMPDSGNFLDFATSPALSMMTKPEGEFNKYAEGIDTILNNMALENQRIENVLQEKFGDNYLGKDAIGGLTTNDRDSLARRSQFADKFAFFKRKYPEGRLLRTGVGGKKTEMLYSLTKDGPLYRVDPKGGFSDFAGDFGDFTGTFLNFATAGGVVGSFVAPFFGTGGGVIFGAMLDKALADEGVDVEDKSFRQKLTDSFTTDVALQGLIEASINKFAPGMGRYFVDKMLGKGGVPFGAFVGKTPPTAVTAQKFAQKEGLPLLSISQLATRSPILQKMAQQVGGTSNILQEMTTTQQKKLYQKAKEIAKQDISNLSQGELMFTIDNLGKNIISDTIGRVQTIEGKAINVRYEDIVEDLDIYKKGMNELIDRTFTKAFSSARTDNVKFDISGLGVKIDDILTGTQIKMAKKGKNKQNLYEKIGGELQGDLGNLLAQLKRADTDVGTISVKTFGKRRTFDALKQMLTVRNKLSDIVSQKGEGAFVAKELMDEIDKVIDTPTGGSGQFKKFLDDARKLTKEKTDVINFTSLGTLFDRNAGLNVMKTMKSLYDGNINATDLKLLKNFMRVSKEGGTKAVSQANNIKTMENIQDGFIQYTLQNIDTGATLIKDIAKDQELFNLLVPNANTRKALLTFTDKQNWLKNSATVKAMERELVDAESAFNEIAKSTQAEFINKINATGGVNGKYAEKLRLHVLSTILDKPSVTRISDIDGSTVVNGKALTKELDDLKRFAGQYSNLKPLFAKAGKPNEIDNNYFKNLEGIRIYGFFANIGEDAGASFATGSEIGKATRGQLFEFVQSVLPRNILAKLMSMKPSVAQLEQAHSKPSGFLDRSGKLNKLSGILTSIERELGLVSEDITPGFEDETRQQEFKRTGEPPFMGDQVSQNTITPNTLNLNLPTVSGGGSVGSPPSNTNFASLFPFDTTGSAISSRAGIGGLV